MTNEMRELYQEVILDHNRSPRNFGPLEGANHTAKGHNPLCGDQVTINLIVDGDVVVDIHFEGSGCAISTASASVMTQLIKGKTISETEALFAGFHDLVMGKEAPQDMGKLAVFAGVSEFPMRVKCATLCWHTTMAALKEGEKPVSTE